MHIRGIIATHPDVQGPTSETLLRAIGESVDCAQTCMACADACDAALSELQ
ncbi:MAG: hypothetical protein K2Y04_05030 [Caulobacteraceae bacterium]|nr:hypothetical protein [Caulobacteraceae bacterium]